MSKLAILAAAILIALPFVNGVIAGVVQCESMNACAWHSGRP